MENTKPSGFSKNFELALERKLPKKDEKNTVEWILKSLQIRYSDMVASQYNAKLIDFDDGKITIDRNLHTKN